MIKWFVFTDFRFSSGARMYGGGGTLAVSSCEVPSPQVWRRPSNQLTMQSKIVSKSSTKNLGWFEPHPQGSPLARGRGDRHQVQASSWSGDGTQRHQLPGEHVSLTQKPSFYNRISRSLQTTGRALGKTTLERFSGLNTDPRPSSPEAAMSLFLRSGSSDNLPVRIKKLMLQSMSSMTGMMTVSLHCIVLSFEMISSGTQLFAARVKSGAQVCPFLSIDLLIYWYMLIKIIKNLFYVNIGTLEYHYIFIAVHDHRPLTHNCNVYRSSLEKMFSCEA